MTDKATAIRLAKKEIGRLGGVVMGRTWLREGSAAEVVVGDVFFFDPEIVQHLEYGCIHHRRTAQIVFDIFRGRVILQMIFVDHVMNEPDVSLPVVFWLGFREGDIELEVGEVLFDFFEMVDIEKLAQASPAVPIGNLSIGLPILE